MLTSVHRLQRDEGITRKKLLSLPLAFPGQTRYTVQWYIHIHKTAEHYISKYKPTQ
jgi:hypothetical protein